MRHFGRFSLAFLLLLLVASAPIVGASAGQSAAYEGDGVTGVLVLNSGDSGYFRVYAEQPNGAYTPVVQGPIQAGQQVSVAVSGGGYAGNNSPAWFVEFAVPGGAPVVIGVTGPNDDELWGWY